METNSALSLTVVLVVVIVAACMDLWNFRIYNMLTIPFCLLGLSYHFVSEGSTGVAGSVMGLLVANVPFIPLYMMGGMGAGDMKLMAGVGAWLGPWAMLHVIIVSGLATGLYSAVLVVWNRTRKGIWLNKEIPLTSSPIGSIQFEKETEMTAMLGRVNRRRNAVPFGAMVALGVIATELWLGMTAS